MNKKLNIKVQKLSEKGIIPTKGSEYCAGYDLYSSEDTILLVGERKLIKTNISIKIPEGYYGRIAPRSGLALKRGIMVMAGIIDSDYTGEIGVILFNSSFSFEQRSLPDGFNDDWSNVCTLFNNRFIIKTGDRIEQLIIEKHYDIDFEIVDKLPRTERNNSGFGHSGI